MTKKLTIIFHIITVILLLASLCVGIFAMKTGYVRTIESGRDFGLSFGYYIAEMFKLDHNITPTVAQPSILDKKEPSEPILPDEPSTDPSGPSSSIGYDETTAQAKSFGKALISLDNFLAYLNWLSITFAISLPFLLAFAGIIGISIYLIKKIYERPNTKHGKETLPLRIFKVTAKGTYQPIKRFILYYKCFLQLYDIYPKIAALIWLINVNAVSIILEFIAYLLYWSMTATFKGIGFQLYKLWFDAKFMFTCVPIPFYFIVAGVLFHNWRYERAYQRLERNEEKNKETFSDLPIVTLFVGKMGTGKDLSSVDIALTKSVQYRQDALNIMLKNDMRFPYFPWIVFEIAICELACKHLIYNLFLCRKFVKNIRQLWEENPSSNNLFGYDFERYNMEFDNGNKIISLWDALTDYAQAYFIYTTNTSLIFSNHAIREDNELIDYGNLPIWNVDFFRRSPKDSARLSKYSHILNMNMLRMGVKMGENDPYQDLVEFGIFVFSEAGKDRGNQNDHKLIQNIKFNVKSIREKIKKYEKSDYEGKAEIVKELQRLDNKYINLLKSKKKTDFVSYNEIYAVLDYIEEHCKEECTPLNDYFNLMLKMIRHMATIDNICFACMLMNDQRHECLNADAKALTDVLTLKSKTNERIVLPFAVYDEMALNIAKKVFDPLYLNLRALRGDTTLLIHLLKTFTSKIVNHWERINNKFGVFDIPFTREDGAMEDTKAEKRLEKIIIDQQKDFNDRYTSTGFSGYFEERVKRSKFGIVDAPSFADTNAKWSEHLATHGHFINKLAEFMENNENIAA